MRLLKPAGLVLVSFLMGVAVTRYYDTHRVAQPVASGKAPDQAATTHAATPSLIRRLTRMSRGSKETLAGEL